MSRPNVVVFAGPTVTAAEVTAVLPGAEVRPPAGRGDLLAGDWRPGAVAVLVDGYFRERRSVGHKEILWLMGTGTRVVGAASMGALRAAELAPYGMVGLGEVYASYASGELDGDDEVGVLHGPAAKGYPARTVALVNLRYAARKATEAGRVSAGAAGRVVAAARELPFAFRTWPDIADRVDAADRDELARLRAGIESGEWDRKRLDALAALRAVAEGRIGPAAAPTPDVTETGILRTQVLAARSRREYAPGRWMSDLDVLDAARLFDPDYPARHEAVLTGILADLAAACPTTPAEYARARLGVDEGAPLPDALARWLTETERADRTPAEQLRLVLVRVWPVWHSVDWRPDLVDHLLAGPDWPRWTDLVAEADEIAERTRYRVVVPPPAVCAKLFLRHWLRPGSSPEIEMARRGFAGAEELGGVVRRFFAYDVRRSRGDR